MSDQNEKKIQETQPVKRGKASWKPANELQPAGLDSKNYRYRFVRPDEQRIGTLVSQGWEICSATNGERAYKGPGSERMVDGRSLDTVVGDRDRIMMRLPLEAAKERDAFYEEKAKRNVKGIKSNARGNIETAQGITLSINDREIED